MLKILWHLKTSYTEYWVYLKILILLGFKAISVHLRETSWFHSIVFSPSSVIQPLWSWEMLFSVIDYPSWQQGVNNAGLKSLVMTQLAGFGVISNPFQTSRVGSDAQRPWVAWIYPPLPRMWGWCLCHRPVHSSFFTCSPADLLRVFVKGCDRVYLLLDFMLLLMLLLLLFLIIIAGPSPGCWNEVRFYNDFAQYNFNG